MWKRSLAPSSLNAAKQRKLLSEKDTQIKFVSNHELIKKLSRPFKCPVPNYVRSNSTRNLGMRRPQPKSALHDPNMPNAFVLYSPPESSEHDKLDSDCLKLVHVVVDPLLGDILTPHEKKGVKFMYDCITGVQIPGSYGCIMADEMGLGKTLQCITLLWTLTRQGPQGKPIIKKCIIVCPSSLVKNWSNESDKWLGGRLQSVTVDGTEAKKDARTVYQFMKEHSPPVLIISYEAFTNNADILHSSRIGLVLCDEGHRLKNGENQTYRALMGLKAKRRILLSGMPMQDDLLNYLSLIHFVNERLLGGAWEFKGKFEELILKGQDSMVTALERQLTLERLQELTAIVNKCLMRRTSSPSTNYLPVKFEMIIICQLTPLQKQLYLNYINSASIKQTVMGNEGAKATSSSLANITTLMKLCNHPDLISDKILEGAEGFERSKNLIPSKNGDNDVRPELSGKLILLDCFLVNLKANYNDKIVLVSNYTQTLDLFEQLCKRRGYLYFRLDGNMSIEEKAKVVQNFNNPESQEFIFMLNSKTGVCGLNLIGANRLIIFDPDWNSANDDQVMTSVWRDGQQKPCYIYRFLAAGSIEEKIFQKQIHESTLSSVVEIKEETARHFSVAELRDLFRLENTESDIHQKLKCNRCLNHTQIKNPPDEADCTNDLSLWYHCWDKNGLVDMVLKQVWDTSKYISFVFYQKSSCREVGHTKTLEEEETNED